MTKDIVIFGAGDTAEQAEYYFRMDSEYRVVAFTVHQNYLAESTFCNLPLIPFEEIVKTYPPSGYDMFIASSGRSMNRPRAEVVRAAKHLGYQLVSYVSTKATVCTSDIGENCFILENVSIQPFVRMGDNVFIWSGSHIGHHSVIGSHVFFSGQTATSGRSEVGDYCFLAGKSGVDANVCLAEGTLLTLGSIATKNTEPWGVYSGIPARKRKMLSSNFKIL